MVGLSAALLDQLVDQRAVRIRKIFADDGLGFADRLPVRAQMELVVLRLQNDRVAGSKLELVAQLIPNLRCFDSHWIVVNSAVCCFLSLQGDAARGRSMAEALAIRDDIPVEELRRVARRETNGRVASRLLALANALDGMARGQAARQAGMDRQTLRDWVIRFNAEGVDGLHDRPKSGRPIWLDDGELATLKALVLRGPDPERDGVSTWRTQELCRIVEQRCGVRYSENGMLRLLHDLGLSFLVCALAAQSQSRCTIWLESVLAQLCLSWLEPSTWRISKLRHF
jgi:transposase